MSLEENIKKWVLLDNNIKNLTNEIKQLKQVKNTYNANIINYISTNELNNATIKISDGKLKFVNVNYPQPLTYKFIYECFIKCFNNENKAQELLNFIKSERDIKTIKEIKRYSNSQ